MSVLHRGLVVSSRIALIGSCCLLPNLSAAAPKSPTFLKSCIISVPEPAPFFPKGFWPLRRNAGTAEAPAAAKDDASKDDSETDDETGDDDADAPRGFIAPGSNSCVAISGTLSFGLQRDWYKANRLATATGQVPVDATSFPLSLTFRLESAQTLGNGVYMATAFEFQVDKTSGSDNDLTLSEASVTLGPWVFGLAGSRFDFWSGDDFIFIGRIPSRTVGIIGYERALTDTVRWSLSTEDVEVDRRALPSQSGRRVPDGVARLVYESGGLTLHGAVALRDVPGAGTASSRLGRAAIIGATWEKEILGRPMTISGQVASAVDAAPYIGSQLDRRAVLSILTGDDSTRGWSSVVSLRREWTDQWSSNVYVSRYRLALPGLGVRPGRINIDRLAANLVWSPVKGFKAGIETSLAWQQANIVGRTAAASLAGRQTSVQLFLERAF